MNIDARKVLRLTILVASSAVMLVGALVMAGVLVPRSFPGEYAFMFGLVAFLYGMYRFVFTYFRKRDG